jgi:response regulator RpfG family c-di-GMP phosphodiesterase
VVVSDMQMPGMNGAAFLGKVREVAPDTVRILLTGHANLDAAIAAINEGYLFRFLHKPCKRDVLLSTLSDAVEQFRLKTAERVLLDQTLRGCIKMLTEILSMANPAAFGRANRARQMAAALVQHSESEQRWAVEVAAMLSQVGCVTLPPEVADKLYHGRPLTPGEAAMTERLPDVAEVLLAHIPRMEPVRDILRYQAKHFDGSGMPLDQVREGEIPLGARMLKLVLDYIALEAQGKQPEEILNDLQQRIGCYDPALLAAVAEIQSCAPPPSVQAVMLDQVKPGMVLAADVMTRDGVLLIARGQEVSVGLFTRLRNMALTMPLQEPLHVYA